MKDGDPLKDLHCRRITFQIILGTNQLRIILRSLKEEPTVSLKKELAEWVKYMSKLNKQSISLLRPGYVQGLRRNRADYEIPRDK
jgi:hypothetical protein